MNYLSFGLSSPCFSFIPYIGELEKKYTRTHSHSVSSLVGVIQTLIFFFKYETCDQSSDTFSPLVPASIRLYDIMVFVVILVILVNKL